MAADTPAQRPRRQFTSEFKTQAVRLVLEAGQTVGAVARGLDLTASALRLWVDQARADRTKGKTGLTTVEREELARLRKENRQLHAVMESFFSTVKNELADQFASHGDAKMELFDYIEVFYNQQRRHSTIGRNSPAAFERRGTITQAA